MRMSCYSSDTIDPALICFRRLNLFMKSSSSIVGGHQFYSTCSYYICYIIHIAVVAHLMMSGTR